MHGNFPGIYQILIKTSFTHSTQKKSFYPIVFIELGTLFAYVVQFCTNHFSPITHAIEQMLHNGWNVLSNIHLTSFDIVPFQAKSRILTKVNTLKPIDGKIGSIITYKECSNCCNIGLTLITTPKTLTIKKC